MKDMGETVQRLTSARDQHETLAEMAQQAGAQEKQGQQADITKILKAQNDAIKGSGASSEGNFPELSEAGTSNWHVSLEKCAEKSGD